MFSESMFRDYCVYGDGEFEESCLLTLYRFGYAVVTANSSAEGNWYWPVMLTTNYRIAQLAADGLNRAAGRDVVKVVTFDVPVDDRY